MIPHPSGGHPYRDPPLVTVDAYATRFAAAVAACGFTWWNRVLITPENFPGERFDGGDYDLESQRLPPKSNGYYEAGVIEPIIRSWREKDATILGGASAGDGLFFSKEVMAGRKDQPNGWIACPGSAPVNYGLLYLRRDDASREADVCPSDGWWCGNGVGLVLLRKVRRAV